MHKIYRFKNVKSTNDTARRIGKEFSVICSERQAAARGRFSRRWSSGKGGLWFSVFLRPKKLDNIHYLTFAAAVACQIAVKRSAGICAKVKWPNDLVYRGKKIAGILTESGIDKGYAIIGIGINTNNRLPRCLSKKAASLKEIKAAKVNNSLILDSFLKEFKKLYNNYEKGKLERILESWKKVSDTLGKEVEVSSLGKQISGKAIGVDKRLRLLIKQGGKAIKVTEGDIS